MTRLVIGVDSSTQSTKAIAWDDKGNAIAEGRCCLLYTSDAADDA